MTDASPPAGASMPGVSRAYARYALFVLLIVYIINYVDRQVQGSGA